MPTIPEDVDSVDYRLWLERVLGWDAALPFFVSTGAILIAKTLKNQPPADILALVGLPVLAFAFRLVVGICQIKGNACGQLFQRFQFCALVLGLFVFAFVDFFVALMAFVPKGNAPNAKEMLPLYILTVMAYVTFVAFAMYPGRQPKNYGS